TVKPVWGLRKVMRLTTPCNVCPPPASEPIASYSSPAHPPTAVMVSAPFSPLLRGRRRASSPGVAALARLPGFQGLQGDEAGADGHEHHPGPVIDPHLPVDGRDVVFHRVGADEQFAGN